MQPEPYLIAHLVRGQPAFDIAIQLDFEGTPSDPGPWWIIPTSGHRAYPTDYIKLRHLCDGAGDIAIECLEMPDPETARDHYAISTIITAADEEVGKNLAQALGLVKHAPIKRRL